MVDQPSDEFLLLASTLFEALPQLPETIGDRLLLQLHAIYGPMLLSALQLVDRREVVCVTLPGRRDVYQVTSAKGIPYTLHVDLSPRRSPAEGAAGGIEQDVETDKEDVEGLDPEVMDVAQDQQADEEVRKKQDAAESRKHIYKLSERLRGDRNIFCKHLLAVIIAHATGRAVQTEVPLKGVVDLLGLNAMSPGDY